MGGKDSMDLVAFSELAKLTQTQAKERVNAAWTYPHTRKNKNQAAQVRRSPLAQHFRPVRLTTHTPMPFNGVQEWYNIAVLLRLMGILIMGRPTYDGIGWIYKGDTTDHGGVVIEGYENCTWDGIPVARLACKVYCPQCAGIHTITEANGFSVHDVNFAVENDPTSCGARLLAKRAPASLLAVAQAFIDGKPIFDESFTLKDKDTGEAFPNMPYTVEFQNGNFAYGVSDENGMTERYYTPRAEPLIIHLGHIGK
jgi:uncharacterized Zn-binding protein involved in type VI secretion